MSKQTQKTKKGAKQKDYTLVQKHQNLKEFTLPNGLTVLFMHIPNTGVVTSNITYKVGARDEGVGETGLAHMLEHMLFKPTKQDLARKLDSSAMQFERETGCTLNANTWKDRTTYFFSYPKQYFKRALQIEAERMHDLVLTDEEFLPERGNVLSEFDMYFGDPYFALSVEMVCSAFHNHPYGHETIGFREDIEGYTVEKLKRFYEQYYNPGNATLTIAGDITEKEALQTVTEVFGTLQSAPGPIQRLQAREPKQEGVRRVEIVRPALSNILAFGVKHPGFPSKEWFTAMLLGAILTDGENSILHKELVDTGLASKVTMQVEPTSETNLALLFVTLSKKASHEQIEEKVLQIVHTLTAKHVAPYFKKALQKIILQERLHRESSLDIALELTEYVSAGCPEAFFQTEAILKSITPSDIVRTAHALFDTDIMTIGRFIGKS